MSTKIYTAQKSRPYKVEVFGLQDDYIGTLQSFADLSIGRVQDSKVTLSKDGTQEFTCSIPRFYINPKTNEKIINPRWEDIKNGVLAENTRVLKVFVIEEGETKVYPFIVDKIIDKRDSHFSVYKEITASGLAFAELGKVGLRLELNKDIVEADYKKDKNTVATLNYWLDKVFPRDESGRWLTPWSYEIRMDWSNYSDKDQRETNKMYDDIQVDKWTVTKEGRLIPAGTSKLQEKARYINSDKGSNKYNITQTIAETFGIFCVYEYKCEPNGQFVKTYVDENGRNMTGRTAVFYNRAIKTENPFALDYQKNLQSISRTCDTSEIYTKLFVDPIQSNTMTDGYVTIANTAANPSMDEFILNFDYLYSKGSITEYQKDFIDKYSVEIHKINEELRNKGELINLLTVEINDKKAEKAGAEKSVSAIQEELTHYQTLRDNDVTNTPVVKDKNNSYSVAFVKDSNKTSPYYRADLRLKGILSSSINGYKNYKYEETIFTYENLISSQDFKPVAENDKNMYVVLDEDGYAVGLYTGYAEQFKADDLENDYIFDTGYIVYLALQYSPHNKYVEVCNRFERMIAKNKNQIAICDNFIKSKQAELDKLITSQSELLAKKDSLNQKLEYIMGPALREGHWSAEDYEDIGRKTEATIKVRDEAVDDVSLVFGTELFDGEEKGYYYASAKDVSDDNRTYYDYIDISSYLTDWKDKNPEDLVIHLTQPEFRYTVPKSQVNGLAAGNYFILYNMTKYYFSLKQALKTGNILRIQNLSEGTVPIALQMSTDNGDEWTNIKFEEYDEEKNYANLTDIFEGLNKYLSTYKIYPNAGFIYGFISQGKVDENSIDKTTKAVKPVLLLNNPEINYSIYKQIGYSFGDESKATYSLYKTNEKLVMCYPRIVVAKNNVNYDDDLLTITEENVEKALVKFEDYSVLLRNGQPRFNLKVTKNTTPYALLNKNYTIVYRFSQANEMLYRDALEVARENSRPRFSYDVSVAQLPNTVESYELGQLGYINDSALGVKAAKGYISSITLVLDSPKDDEIQIQNYKTKFEDLFATITASSEAMKSNQQSYDIAASIINPSTGSIQGSILQDSFNNNKVELTYSNTQVHIDDTDGITLTNTEPYSNGVYGQVVMRGGGIFLSNTVDSNYNRIWTTGITPNGINASTITTGQLDANLVRIFAGNNVAFQWNSEGIYAYKRDENNQFLPNTYVRYSDKGLQYLDDGFTAVDLGWNGLAINTQGGSLTLTGKDGLVVYDGLQNDSENPTNHLIKIGKFEEDENISYGMRLYKPVTIGEDTSYTETLITSNDGHLWLKDYIEVGNKANSDDGVSIYGAGVSGLVNSEDDVISGGGANLGGSSGSTNTGGAGLSGIGDPNKSVRFWAGSSFDTRDAAPFRVLQDGTCYATSLYIGGNSSINGSSVNDIVTVMNNYNSKLFSSNGFVYNRETTTQTILFCSATKNGVEVAALPDNYLLTLEYCERSSGEWFVKQTSFGERFNVTVDMDENYSYRSVLKYIDSKGELQAVFGDVITFIAVSNGEQGDSIDTIDEQYATSTNINITPTDWKDSLEEVDFSQDNPYLWVKEVYNYSNGTSSDPVYRIAAVYGQKGVGIEKIANYYLVTNLKTGVKIEGNAWILVGPEEATKEIPNTTYFCPYLWHYEKIIYTDDSFTNTSPRLIEVRGVSITGVTNQYILSTSNTEILDQEGNARKEEDWKNSYEEAGSPSAEWPYLWSREVVNYDEAIDYESGDKFKILPARLIATYGDGVVGIDEYYLLADTNSVNSLPTTDWDGPNPEEVPIPTAELRFLWNKEVKKYTNGREEPTSPRIIGMYGEVGKEGPAGRSVREIIEEYVLSSSNQNPLADEDSKWGIDFKSPTEDKPFLWNREGIWYSDKETFEYPSDPVIIATYVKDGRGIEEIRNYYCIYKFSSGVEKVINKEGYTWEGPDFSENPIPVPTNEKPYLWNYEEIVWSDGNSSTTDACVVGTLGLAGRGVEDIKEWYLYTETNGNQPESDDPNWSLTLPTFDSSKPYLWIKEIVTYNIEDENNSTIKEFIRLMSVSGQVSDIVNYYWANDMSTAPSLEEYPLPPNEKVDTWTKEEQNTTLEKRYLWNCEVITYTVPDAEGNTSKTFGPRVIGVHGATGDTGPAGISVANIEEVYGCSSSATVRPTKWYPDPQVPDKDNPFLWCKETVIYDYGKDSQTFVRIIGTYSKDGRSITKIENYYWANSIITPPPSLDDYPLPPDKKYVANTWVKEEQTTSVDNPYLWNCEVISYDKPVSGEEENTPTILGPRLIGTQGKDGINGAPGRDIEQIEEQYARNNSVTETPSNWSSTFKVPEPNNQYLWAREKITYSTDTNNDGIKDVAYTKPRIISSYVEGGRGIERIDNYYLASSKSSGVAKEDITKDYDSQRKSLNTNTPYLWSVEKIIYTAGDPSYTTPFIAAYYSATTYTWIKYSNIPNPTSSKDVSDSPEGMSYIGIAYNKTDSNELSDPKYYNWSLIKGANGKNGENGITYYTWIKYATDEEGANMTDDPNSPINGSNVSDYIYIGIAYNKEDQKESDNPDDYTWSLFQGPQGLQGPTGKEGRGIEHIQEYYLRTNSTKPPTDGNPGWRDTLIPEEHTLISTSQYLWMKEVVTYTDTTTKIFKHIIATYAPSGRGIKQIDNYYQVTNSTNPPNFNPKDPKRDNWEPNIIDPTSDTPYLWNVELITWTESDGTESQTNTDPRIIGVHGADGTNAIIYHLRLSVTSITKKLDGSFSPNTIVCSVNKITETTTSNIGISNFKLKVQKQTGNNKTEITTKTTPSNWTISLNSTMSDAESFILTLTNSDGTITYDTLSISCVISDELQELAAIDEDKNEVYIKDGKVRATSIAAYAVTAAKIAAGAIETGGIAAGSELYLYTAGNNQTLAELPIYGKSWTNPVSGNSVPINDVYAYNSAIHTTLNYNYNYSTGGKMKLSSDGVEIKSNNLTYAEDKTTLLFKTESSLEIGNGEVVIESIRKDTSDVIQEQSSLTVSASGITASSATFDSLLVNGKKLFGGADLVIQAHEPEVRNGPTIWIQPQTNTSQVIQKVNNETFQLWPSSKTFAFNKYNGAFFDETMRAIYSLKFSTYATTVIVNGKETQFMPNGNNVVTVKLYTTLNPSSPFVEFTNKIPITRKGETIEFQATSAPLANILTEALTMPGQYIYFEISASGSGNGNLTIKQNTYVQLAVSIQGSASGGLPCSVYYFEAGNQ